MIGVIDCSIQAKFPNMPLEHMAAYVGSPSSIRVRNVPKRIGKWAIESVQFVAAYPDSSIKTANCVLTGGVWVGTIEGTSTSGTSENGYTIFASGTDENGNAVTGYILGKGDITILEADGTLSPDPARYYVKLLSAEAEQPREGDLYPTESGYVIWQNGQANLLGTPFEQITAYVESAISAKADLSAIHGDYIEDEYGNKICADRTVEVVEQGEQSWTLTDGTNTYTLTGTRLNSIWGTTLERYTLVGQEDEENNVGAWTLKYVTPLPGTSIWVTRWTEFYDGTFGEQSLTFPTHDFTATWNDGKQITQDELALKSDLPMKTSDLTNDSGFITSADVPTKTSDLTNDSGFITAAQIPTPSYIEDADGNRINANFSAKKSTTHKTWYVTDTRHSGNKYSLTPIDNFLSAEFFPDTPVEEESYGFRIQLVQNGDDYTGTFYDYFYVNGVWEENEAWEVEFLNGETSVQCDQYFVEYSNILTDVTIATTNDLPTKTSDLSNDSGFITSAEIEPYHYVLTPTENTGLANIAFNLALADQVSFEPVKDGAFSASLRTNRDLTKQFRAKMGLATYYPYVMSMYNGQTLSPELSLYFCKDQLRYGTTRPRTYYEGYMFRTAGAGFAIPCSEDGTPDGRLVETTAVKGNYVLMQNNTTSIHSIGFTTVYDDPYREIITLDGQSDMIYARRTNAYKTYLFSEEIANKSELPTKTSELSNDSGFITSADIITKRDLSDMTVKGVPQNTNSQSWFGIRYGTTTENARYYDEGRWESSNTTRVLAASANIYTLQKIQESQWTNIGEFQLDNNSEATITYDGVTYSITGYVGEIVTSNQLTSQIAALEARIAALEGN